ELGRVPPKSTPLETGVSTSHFGIGLGGGSGGVSVGGQEKGLGGSTDIIKEVPAKETPTTIISQFEKLELRVQEALSAARDAESKQQVVNEALLRRIEDLSKPPENPSYGHMTGSEVMSNRKECKSTHSSVRSIPKDDHVTMRKALDTRRQVTIDHDGSRYRTANEVVFDISTPQPAMAQRYGGDGGNGGGYDGRYDKGGNRGGVTGTQTGNYYPAESDYVNVQHHQIRPSCGGKTLGPIIRGQGSAGQGDYRNVRGHGYATRNRFIIDGINGSDHSRVTRPIAKDDVMSGARAGSVSEGASLYVRRSDGTFEAIGKVPSVSPGGGSPTSGVDRPPSPIGIDVPPNRRRDLPSRTSTGIVSTTSLKSVVEVNPKKAKVRANMGYVAPTYDYVQSFWLLPPEWQRDRPAGLEQAGSDVSLSAIQLAFVKNRVKMSANKLVNHVRKLKDGCYTGPHDKRSWHVVQREIIENLNRTCIEIPRVHSLYLVDCLDAEQSKLVMRKLGPANFKTADDVELLATLWSLFDELFRSESAPETE
ncbi:hypothetical protein FOZ62_006515, partial [Perkinsus olseni]